MYHIVNEIISTVILPVGYVRCIFYEYHINEIDLKISCKYSKKQQILMKLRIGNVCFVSADMQRLSWNVFQVVKLESCGGEIIWAGDPKRVYFCSRALISSFRSIRARARQTRYSYRPLCLSPFPLPPSHSSIFRIYGYEALLLPQLQKSNCGGEK